MSTRPGSELVSIPRQTESVHQTHFLLQKVRSAISSSTYSPQLRKQASASLRNQFRVKLRILNLYSNKNEHSCQKSAQSAHPGYTDVGMTQETNLIAFDADSVDATHWTQLLCTRHKSQNLHRADLSIRMRLPFEYAGIFPWDGTSDLNFDPCPIVSNFTPYSRNFLKLKTTRAHCKIVYLLHAKAQSFGVVMR